MQNLTPLLTCSGVNVMVDPEGSNCKVLVVSSNSIAFENFVFILKIDNKNVKLK